MTENLLDADDNSAPLIDPNKNYLEELVGEGKKFKTPEELALGKARSDLYIRDLERQKDELRADYERLHDEYKTGPKLQEILDQLTEQRLASSESPQANEVIENQPAYDPKQIESLVSSKISEYEMTKKQQENFNVVKGKLQERYGDSYHNVLKEQINRLGLTDEDVNTLAKKSPDAFFRLVGLDQPVSKDNFQAPPRSNQRSDNFSPTSSKRTWAYYQKMRTESPKVYNDPKTQVQMHKDYIELGTAFEDGDFKN